MEYRFHAISGRKIYVTKGEGGRFVRFRIAITLFVIGGVLLLAKPWAIVSMHERATSRGGESQGQPSNVAVVERELTSSAEWQSLIARIGQPGSVALTPNELEYLKSSFCRFDAAIRKDGLGNPASSVNGFVIFARRSSNFNYDGSDVDEFLNNLISALKKNKTKSCE